MILMKKKSAILMWLVSMSKYECGLLGLGGGMCCTERLSSFLHEKKHCGRTGLFNKHMFWHVTAGKKKRND